MATPINTPSNGDIWHLSIDDLLAPLPEKTRLGGPGPFVINLSASSAPIDLPVTNFAGCEHAHIYQVQRTEDRRPRYRLRLGPFANEDLAEAILAKVRESYPSALTATADADDLRAMKALDAKANPPPPAPPLGVESKPAAAKPAALSPPVLNCEFKAPIRAPAPKPPVVREAVLIRRGVPSLESTQTVRALTQLELEDEQASRWFVIQLSLAEEAFDPDTVPNLDIFSVYRLYSVAGIDQGRIVHALRVGFFSEDTAAAAVATYLAAFYDKPAVKRVSAAERRRFAEQPLQPRKDVGSTGKQAVIEITNERYIREKRGGHAAGK